MHSIFQKKNAESVKFFMRTSSSDALKDLQRCIRRLSMLDALFFPSGKDIYLLHSNGVKHPEVLLKSFQSNTVLSRDDIRNAFWLLKEPKQVTKQFLAVCKRDISVFKKYPKLLSRTKEAPRLFRGYTDLNAQWLQEKEDALKKLIHLQTTLITQNPDQNRSWFSKVLFYIYLLHGQEASKHIQQMAIRSQKRGKRQRDRIKKRVEAILATLKGITPSLQPPAIQETLTKTATKLKQIDKLPGRARAKRISQILWTLFFWPNPAPDNIPNILSQHETLPSRSLVELIEQIANKLIKETFSGQSSKEEQTRLYQVLSYYGLLFACRFTAPKIRTLSLVDSKLALRHFSKVKKNLSQLSLSFEQVFGIVKLIKPYKLEEDGIKQLGTWLAQGFEWNLLQKMAKKGFLPNLLLAENRDASFARFYSKSLLRILPFYEKLGITPSISPEDFVNVQKNSELEILGHCLSAYQPKQSSASIEEQLGILDTTFSLFQKLPKQSSTALRSLRKVHVGLGKKHLPEFAKWLDDDALLDHYLSLCQLLNLPLKLSKNLQRDFVRKIRYEKEFQFLSSCKNLSKNQQKTLENLRNFLSSDKILSPKWTKRRIQEKFQTLLTKGFEIKLDEVLKNIIKSVWKINIKNITPEWRDAVRFYLNIDQNHSLLGKLLQISSQHPGEYIAPKFPKNQEWLEKVPTHIDLQTWIHPETIKITLAGKPYKLSLEADPLLVLRMGIPFGTCLSLEDGFNAASTVLNALDINKRVLYLKDSKGSLVARKLVAISTNYKLLGYYLYSSLPKSLKPEVSKVFQEFCQDLSKSTGLSFSTEGTPETIHKGFWYDDGTVSFQEQENSLLEQYFKALKLPFSSKISISDELEREASRWYARKTKNIKSAIDYFGSWNITIPNVELGDWIIKTLGEKEILKNLEQHKDLIPALLRYKAKKSANALLETAEKCSSIDPLEDVFLLLREFPPSKNIAKQALVTLSRTWGKAEYFTDHGIEHNSMYHFHRYAVYLTPKELLEACNILGPAWDWVVNQAIECTECRESAEMRIKQAAIEVYAKTPQPKEILSCFQKKRNNQLTYKVALHIAANFPLSRSKPNQNDTVLPFFYQKTQISPRVIGILQSFRKIYPEFEKNPDMLAALLRQGFGQNKDHPYQKLPIPENAAFEVLGNLLLEIPELPEELFTSWTVSNRNISNWKPGAWELFYHRRHKTPWRKILIKEIQKGKEEKKEALQWLIELGEEEKFQKLYEKTSLKLPFVSNASKIISDIKWQMTLDNETLSPKEFSKECSQYHYSKNVDPSLVSAAFNCIKQELKKNLPEILSPRSKEVLEVLEEAKLPLQFWINFMQWLWQNPDAAAKNSLIKEYTIEFLEQKIQYRYFDIPTKLLLILWQVKDLQNSVLLALQKVYPEEWPSFYKKIIRTSKNHNLPINGFLEAWIERLIVGNTYLHSFVITQDRTLLKTLCKVAIEKLNPQICLMVYQAFPDACSVKIFLKILNTYPKNISEKLLKIAYETSWDDHEKWLRLCLLHSSKKRLL